MTKTCIDHRVSFIEGKETKAKLKAFGKALVDCWNEVK